MFVKDIQKLFMQKLLSEEFVTDKTGVKTIELIGTSFIADKPMIFGTPNQDYIDRELEWYYSQSLYVKDIPGETPKIWEQIANEDGMINSNYGYLIFSPRNHSQYNKCLNELKKHPDSRRAVMVYQRPTIYEDYCKNGMSDFICTNAVQYLIRDNALHGVVQMRSNDVVFGYRNDYAWQLHVQQKLAGDLNLDVGDLHWCVGSLHVYERHFKMIHKHIENIEKQNKTVSLIDKIMGNTAKI